MTKVDHTNRLTPHPSPLPVEGRGGAHGVSGQSIVRRRVHHVFVTGVENPKRNERGDIRSILNEHSPRTPSPLNGLRAEPRREISPSLAGVRGENDDALTLRKKLRSQKP